jgi:hypothetical protein
LIAPIALVSAAYAVGDAPASSVIHACAHPANGALRLVASPADCRQPESPISWNQQGPAGQPGPAGLPGPKANAAIPAIPARKVYPASPVRLVRAAKRASQDCPARQARRATRARMAR